MRCISPCVGIFQISSKEGLRNMQLRASLHDVCDRIIVVATVKYCNVSNPRGTVQYP